MALVLLVVKLCLFYTMSSVASLKLVIHGVDIRMSGECQQSASALLPPASPAAVQGSCCAS